MLREIIAEELECVEVRLLPDGRIRQDWVPGADGHGGFSFFWLEQHDLYVIFISRDNNQSVYQPAKYQIRDSFRFSN